MTHGEYMKLDRQPGNDTGTTFNEFYKKYAPFVLHISMKITGDKSEAEDVCHNVFLEIYQHPDEYQKEKGHIKSWLAVKTKSRSIDYLRKKKPLLIQKLKQLDTRKIAETESFVFSHIEEEMLIDALKSIPKKQAKVIYGMYFEGKTQKELARSLNKPIGSIKSSIRYGLKNLKKQPKIMQWTKSNGGE